MVSENEDKERLEKAVINGDPVSFLILYERVEINGAVTSLYNSIIWVRGQLEDAARRARIMQRDGHRVHAIIAETCWVDEAEWRLSEDEIKEKGPE